MWRQWLEGQSPMEEALEHAPRARHMARSRPKNEALNTEAFSTHEGFRHPPPPRQGVGVTNTTQWPRCYVTTIYQSDIVSRARQRCGVSTEAVTVMCRGHLSNLSPQTSAAAGCVRAASMHAAAMRSITRPSATGAGTPCMRPPAHT